MTKHESSISYFQGGTVEMINQNAGDAYKERVIDEKERLDDKINKLDYFIKLDTYHSLPDSEKALLTEQLDVMEKYSDILAKRIAIFISQPETR